MQTSLYTQFDFADFTENGYTQVLDLAKSRYSFEPYGTNSTEKHVLWRHDVDFSIHRALRIAQIEANKEVQSTYFILLHSDFYNVFEKSISKKIQQIISLGHHIGLHFDMDYYPPFTDKSQLEAKLQWEKSILEDLFAISINAFSFHNPDIGNALQYADAIMAGMHNTYGQKLRDDYLYCSDSNGYWRYQRLLELLENTPKEKLHILTHPEWWVPQPMSPRMRVSRCIDGMAARLHQRYDELIAIFGRENIGK